MQPYLKLVRDGKMCRDWLSEFIGQPVQHFRSRELSGMPYTEDGRICLGSLRVPGHSLRALPC